MTKIIGLALAALAFALLLSAGQAQAAPLCEPKTWLNPTAPGSHRVEHWAADGRVDAWWCPGPAPADAPAGTKWFRMANDGGLYALGWEAVKAAAPRVLAASSPWMQAQAERLAIVAAAKPTAAQTCRVTQLAHGACVRLQMARLPGYPGAATVAEALDAGKCGAEPVCTAPPAWVVDVGTDAAKTTRPAFALANGVRAEVSTGRATSGAECKPEVAQSPSLVAGKVFAAYGPTFDARMVALCRKAP